MPRLQRSSYKAKTRFAFSLYGFGDVSQRFALTATFIIPARSAKVSASAPLGCRLEVIRAVTLWQTFKLPSYWAGDWSMSGIGHKRPLSKFPECLTSVQKHESFAHQHRDHPLDV
jgi:hypothetical protein